MPILVFFLTATLLVASISQAAVVGEVISGRDVPTGKWAVMSAVDGSQLTMMDCGGDLTHGGSPRYFVDLLNTGIVLPDDYGGNELIAYDEDCGMGVVITDEPSMRFNGPRWSPDGTRVATFAERWDLSSGERIEQGIYIADVALDATGRPARAFNFRLLVDLPNIPLLSWSGDGSRIAYNSLAPDLQGGTQTDIWVYDLDAEASVNVTNTPETSEREPAFSPLGDRIAFARPTGAGWWDIFTVLASGGNEIRVTTKRTTGQPANRHPCFSPDGRYISFNSSDLSKFYTESRIFKIRADGSGKAVSLYGRRGPVIHGAIWRP